ncbi:hypothetical protein PV729_04340 [Streptomyces europaeiscabiei]|uniref:Uncharacterized protein n=1 Tax=Streptomyces europaeiscabiei TaxID=146819 RepID=A0ABU4N5X9_9ACTN|nr:hypothetical protein [Streptomyces europaeiscabiei]MDX3551007.1 hypothetical protein [Streptomyces europaeiscabiei]MDX3698433.1 hypothetical protein [Streptomyces europaeiscabiei]
MFLTPQITASTNRFVHNSPADTLPAFRRVPSMLEVGGAILRYSTTTPAPRAESSQAGA